MKSFLEHLADELLPEQQDFATLAVVFPTRRASLFFRRALSARISNLVWMPSVYSISDFFTSLSGRTIPDQLTLQSELFKVYRKYYPEEDFGSFLPWADVLLNDFDEADKYLADAGALYRNITDLRQLEETFGLAEEDENRIREFWKTYYDREK